MAVVALSYRGNGRCRFWSPVSLPFSGISQRRLTGDRNDIHSGL
jgi:hypothetical protein